MNTVCIYPSIMCAKAWDVKKFVEVFEKVGITSIHYDVMDGHYVPNIVLGTPVFNDIHSISNLPIDVHLMCEKPEVFVDYFNFRENDMCCFHPECCRQPYRLLQYIKSKGVKAGLAISPAVSLDYVVNCLPAIDYVLFMAINPGFAGQTMLPNAIEKLEKLSKICKNADHKIEIVVDGNTKPENARKMIAAGATGLVAGTTLKVNESPDQFEQGYNDYIKAIHE